MKGTTFIWAETIGTAPVGSGAGANLRGQSGGASAGKVAIVEGFASRGDGGGGVFFWDTSTTPVGVNVDNGGTYIVYNTSLGQNATGNGWRRIYSGALNVKWFGAKGNGATNADGDAIQRALDLVARSGGGTVYLPAGEYLTARQLLFRRTPALGLPNYLQPMPMTLRGAGAASPYGGGAFARNGSTIRSVTGGTLTSAMPLITFDPTDGGQTYFHVIENLSFIRGDGDLGGPIFFHPSDGTLNALRYRASTIRNCLFSTIKPDPPANVNVIHIQGSWNSTIENVMVKGGDWLLHLENSPRASVRMFQALEKDGSNNGIKITGAGGHILSHIRYEGSTGGRALLLTGQCRNILIDMFSTEGWKEDVQIDIDAADAIRFTGLELGGPDTVLTNRYGIRVGPTCTDIRVQGGDLAPYNDPTCKTIRIEGGKHIFFDDVHFQGNTYANVEILGGLDVRVNAYENYGTNAGAAFRLGRDLVDTMHIDDRIVYMDALGSYERGRRILKGGNADFIHGIRNSFDGDRVTLIFTLSDTLLDATDPHTPASDGTWSPLRLDNGVTAPSQLMSPNSSIEFILCEGAWREISRSKYG